MIVETPDGFRWKFEGEAAPHKSQYNDKWYMYKGKRWIKSKKEWSKGNCSSGAYESYKIIEE